MPQLSQAKTMGGVGAILMLLGFVPTVGWVLGLAGAVLVLIAIKYISEIVADPSIFRDMIIAIVLACVGLIVGVAVILAAVFQAIGLGIITPGIAGFTPPTGLPTGGLLGLILSAIVGLAVVWVVLIVSAVFVRRSYGLISKKLGVHMFGTAGLLYLLGAALTIVLVGFILILVAEILNIVAFFSIPEQLPQTQQMPPAQPPSQPM
ncbi:MAG: DUF996 domain-containing protein [Nitrososphaerales archaeon]|nr:DUF996 domain-containing protein [Nitrososphaerales archaeon]